MAKDRYGCATRRSKGTCANSQTIARFELEARVLTSLKHKLLTPDLLKEFMQAYHKEINKQLDDLRSDRQRARKRLVQIDEAISGIVRAVEQGRHNDALLDRLTQLEMEKKELEQTLENGVEPPPVKLHPNLAELYSRKVGELELALNDPSIEAEATEILRTLIEKIVVSAKTEGKGADLTLHGDLAHILTVCDQAENKKIRGKLTFPGSQLSVVAGAGFYCAPAGLRGTCAAARLGAPRLVVNLATVQPRPREPYQSKRAPIWGPLALIGCGGAPQPLPGDLRLVSPLSAPTALKWACKVYNRRSSRLSGSAKTNRQSGMQADTETLEEAGTGTNPDHNRQAQILSRCHRKARADRGAYRQKTVKQSRAKLTSTGATTGTENAEVQITRLRPETSQYSICCLQHLLRSTPSPQTNRVQAVSCRSVRSVGKRKCGRVKELKTGISTSNTD